MMAGDTTMGESRSTLDVATEAEPAPLTARTRLRKEEIVGHATRLFAERGYDGASMGELAERVGLRKASLFHHFESKDVLYAAVLTRLATTAREALARAASTGGRFSERLDALTDAMFALLAEEPCAARLLLRELMDEGPAVRGARIGRERVTDEALSALIAFIEAGQQSGAVRADCGAAHLAAVLLGVWCFPVVVEPSMERLTGASVDATFLAERQEMVRARIRELALTAPTG